MEKIRFWIGIHADDDDERDEAIVSRDLGFLQRPVGPILEHLILR